MSRERATIPRPWKHSLLYALSVILSIFKFSIASWVGSILYYDI